MEIWDDIMRFLRLRRPTGGIAPNGGKFGDEYWFPARRNPWPWIGGAVAIVALVWAGIVWTDDGSSDAAPPTTTIAAAELAGANGLTSRDLSGCMAFKSASSDGSTLFAQAQSPEVEDLAATGALTEDILDGYLKGVEAVVDGFDDATLKRLLTGLRDDLAEQLDQAKKDEDAGAPTWDTLFPVLSKELITFGRSFEARCEKGGVIVDVVPER